MNFLEPILFNSCFNSTWFNSKLYPRPICHPFWLCRLDACHAYLFCTIIYRLYLPIATDDLYYHKSNTFLHLLYALLICFLIGLPFTLIFYFFSKTVPYDSLQYNKWLSTIKIHVFSFFTILFTNTPFYNFTS